jgi:tRNA-2-methylthio-N6-dimethylallyladenosine synthase
VAARGITEVTLLGQTVNSYRHGEWAFPRLLREVARVPGIRRVRFTSPHPADVTPELVRVMADEVAVCEQLHLPLQSGSDRVLKRMVRRYGVDEYLEKVAMVRAAIPDVALSTDVIAAFPGETDADFEATLDVIRAVRFDDAYTYRFSPREGTPATRMPPEWFVPDDVAQGRLERLIEVARDVQADVSRAELGRVEEVLVDRAGREPGQVVGKTRRNKVVAFDGDPAWVGSYREVLLERTSGATFGGRVVEEPVRAETA